MAMSTTSSGSTTFQAWRVRETEDGTTYVGSEQTMSTDDLVVGDDDSTRTGYSLIRVSHSSLNYKDALSAAGNKGVTKHYPHTPGIDAAGTIVHSDDEDNGGGKSNNDNKQVLVTGYDLGMNTNGGFGEYIRVPTDWCVALPENWSPRTAMIYGTAGLTAGLCVQKLLYVGGATPSQGTVAVTGASGSVGSVAVEILATLGFEVVAISGKGKQKQQGGADMLTDLGATQVVGREALEATKKPLVKPVFAHAVDTVGGTPLAELLKQIQPGGSVACCGLVAGPKLETTVLPFILRGINLLGVDSVEIDRSQKEKVWKKLSSEWACPKTEHAARDIGRHQLDDCLKAFLKGEHSGKIVLDHSLTKSNL